jgi:hypothetical protein
MSRRRKITSGPNRANVGTDKAGRIFLHNHTAGMASIDLFVVSTISFKLLSNLKGIHKLDVHRYSRPPGCERAGGQLLLDNSALVTLVSEGYSVGIVGP